MPTKKQPEQRLPKKNLPMLEEPRYSKRQPPMLEEPRLTRKPLPMVKEERDPYLARPELQEGFYEQAGKPVTSFETLMGTEAKRAPNVTDTEYFKTGGGATKPGLWANINRRKRLGISRPKSKSTISKEAYANMKKGFPKKSKGGSVMASGNRLGRTRPTKLY